MNKKSEVTCTYTNTHPYMYVCMGGLVMWSCEKLGVYRFCTLLMTNSDLSAQSLSSSCLSHNYMLISSMSGGKKSLAYFDVVRCCQSPLVNKSKIFIFFAQWAMKNDMYYRARKNNSLKPSIILRKLDEKISHYIGRLNYY